MEVVSVSPGVTEVLGAPQPAPSFADAHHEVHLHNGGKFRLNAIALQK